ncbi:hypothetical protein HN51_070162 [Arachis hypogaea]|uniref:putative fasciclin-like arabinogalactan protein 20 n=2 Tax=Arachis TaxID=3817 RepID=UPI000DECD849|nr:putative fasciclin-like arabinogalactan protein 20 [Arachis hypogaea]
MASTKHFLSLFVLHLLLSISSSLPSSAILDAAEILSASGFDAMAVNLELASQTLASPRTRSLTVFAPSDAAFKILQQPTLSLLRYHLLPNAFSFHSLISLPFGANIPTLLPSHSLTVTTTTDSADSLSINNVTVNSEPLYRDASLVIFTTDHFFDPYFQLPAKIPHRTGTTDPYSSSAAACFAGRKNHRKSFSSGEAFSFKEASSVLRSKGCFLMAELLDTQFLAIRNRPQLTLFAPMDKVVTSTNATRGHVAATNNNNPRLRGHSSILRHHLVPCKILWSDLLTLEEGTLIRTYERGFTLNVTKSTEDVLLVNGVPVISPELYNSDWLVVHGLQEVLSPLKGRKGRGVEGSGRISEAAAEVGNATSYGEDSAAQHFHFSVFH